MNRHSLSLSRLDVKMSIAFVGKIVANDQRDRQLQRMIPICTDECKIYY